MLVKGRLISGQLSTVLHFSSYWSANVLHRWPFKISARRPLAPSNSWHWVSSPCQHSHTHYMSPTLAFPLDIWGERSWETLRNLREIIKVGSDKDESCTRLFSLILFLHHWAFSKELWYGLFPGLKYIRSKAKKAANSRESLQRPLNRPFPWIACCLASWEHRVFHKHSLMRPPSTRHFQTNEFMLAKVLELWRL